MDTQLLGIVTLLRSALNSETLTLPESFDLREAINTIQTHHLTGLALHGAALCRVSRGHPAVVQMTAMFCNDLRTSRSQMQKLGQVYELFDANGIDYLPVKGAVIKSLYPRPEHRVMGDADILIRAEQYPLIRALLPSIGLKEEENCDYEHTWKSPELTLELHRQLFSMRYRNYFGYYSDSWRLARKNERGSGFHLCAEDHFVYLLTHFAKHYLGGTICAKDICDFRIWQKTHPDMDEAYILQELDQLKLRGFYYNIRDLLDNWFADGPATEATQLITRSVFRRGVYEDFNRSSADNTMRRHAAQTDSLVKKKAKWFLHAVFPPCAALSYTHPVLKKYPFLLPVFWVIRWMDAIFRDRDKLRRGMIVMNMDSRSLREYNSHLVTVGLESVKSD